MTSRIGEVIAGLLAARYREASNVVNLRHASLQVAINATSAISHVANTGTGFADDHQQRNWLRREIVDGLVRS